MAARRAVLGAAERVVGAPVRDVVLLVQRRPWAWGAFAVGGVAGLVFTDVAGATEPFDFAIAGGLGGLGLCAGMTYRFLVRTEQQLLVGRMRAMLADLKPPDVPPGYVAHKP